MCELDTHCTTRRAFSDLIPSLAIKSQCGADWDLLAYAHELRAIIWEHVSHAAVEIQMFESAFIVDSLGMLSSSMLVFYPLKRQ